MRITKFYENFIDLIWYIHNENMEEPWYVIYKIIVHFSFPNYHCLMQTTQLRSMFFPSILLENFGVFSKLDLSIIISHHWIGIDLVIPLQIPYSWYLIIMTHVYQIINFLNLFFISTNSPKLSIYFFSIFVSKDL